MGRGRDRVQHPDPVSSPVEVEVRVGWQEVRIRIYKPRLRGKVLGSSPWVYQNSGKEEVNSKGEEMMVEMEVDIGEVQLILVIWGECTIILSTLRYVTALQTGSALPLRDTVPKTDPLI
jgi:hypothetical protein